MQLKIFGLFFVGISFFFLPSVVSAQTGISDLKPLHAGVLRRWLATKPMWRLAAEKDYGQDNLDFFRQGEGASAQPFYAAEDFNKDGKKDFAVILSNGENAYAAAVFNAPFDPRKQQQPSFYTDKIEPGDIVYYNKSARLLLIGPYASDAGFALKPSGKTYKAEYPQMGN